MALADPPSSSTTAQVRATYEDNADYPLAGGSVAKAKEFWKALQILILRMGDEVQSGDERVRSEYRRLQDQLKRVESWLGAHDADFLAPKPGSTVKHFHLDETRG